MFTFPEHCRVDRVLTKEKIYEYASTTKALKTKFVEQVEKVVWKYKLSADTLNLPAKDGISEVQVFELVLRVKAFSPDIVTAIDKAIPYPILFIVRFGDEVKSVMAFKKIDPVDAGKIAINGYFESEWQQGAKIRLEPLPVVLDMRALYEELMQSHVELKRRNGESLEKLLGRALLLHQMERELVGLETRMNNEKQFNRRVELNSEMKKIREKITEFIL